MAYKEGLGGISERFLIEGALTHIIGTPAHLFDDVDGARMLCAIGSPCDLGTRWRKRDREPVDDARIALHNYIRIKPRLWARETACARLSTASFTKMFFICDLTVSGAIASSRATPCWIGRGRYAQEILWLSDSTTVDAGFALTYLARSGRSGSTSARERARRLLPLPSPSARRNAATWTVRLSSTTTAAGQTRPSARSC
jgi:hypothetical protein